MRDMPLLELRVIIGDVDIDAAVGDDAAFVERIFVGMAQRHELVVPLEIRERESRHPAQRVSIALSRARFSFSATGCKLGAAAAPDRSRRRLTLTG